MSEALRACVCGKMPTIQRGGPGNLVWYIECDSPLTENAEHQITLQCGGTRAEAIAAWNTRPVQDALVAALDRTLRNFEALLARKPIRDASETIAEANAALKAAGEPL